MATKVFDLFGDLSLNSGAFARDINQARTALRSTGAQMNRDLARIDNGFDRTSRTVTVLRNGLRGLLPVIGATAGVAGFVGLTRSTLQTADALVDASQKVSLTTDQLQELRFAASEVGVANTTLDMAMQRFSRRVGEAAAGTGELKDTLAQYNIAVRDNSGNVRSQIDILGDLADAMSRAESEQEQLRIAFKAFDSEGAALVSVLRGGRAALDEMRESARDLNQVMSAETVESLDRAADAFRRLGQESRTLFATLVGPLAGAMADILEKFRELREETPFDRQVRLLEQMTNRTESQNEQLREMLRLQRAIGADLPASLTRIGAEGGARPVPEMFGPPIPSDPRNRNEGAVPIPRNFGQRFRPFNREMRDSVKQAELLRTSMFDVGESYAEAAEKMKAFTDEQDLKRLDETMNEIRTSTKLAEQEFERVRRSSERFANTLADGLERAVFEFTSLRDAASDFLQTLGRQIFRQGVTQPLASALTGAIGGIFGGFFANGGFPPPGRASIVGEKGPEIIKPAGRTEVIPLQGARGVARGGPRIAIGSLNVGEGASVEAVAEMEAALRRLDAEFEDRTIATVTDMSSRGRLGIA